MKVKIQDATLTKAFLTLAAVAATPPAKPVSSIASIAEDWKGTFSDNRGAQYPGTMTTSQVGGCLRST